MKNFSSYTDYLMGVHEMDSLRNMALRVLFSEISEDYLTGISGFKIKPSDEIQMEFSAGLSPDYFSEPLTVWDDNPISLCIRKGFPGEEIREGNRFTFIPLIRREGPLGAMVITGNAGRSLPQEFSWLMATIAVAGGQAISEKGNKKYSPQGSGGENPGALSVRQAEILEFMSMGLTNDQIARNLHISNSTVRHESMKIFRHLEVGDRLSASTRAKELGILPISSYANSQSQPFQ